MDPRIPLEVRRNDLRTDVLALRELGNQPDPVLPETLKASVEALFASAETLKASRERVSGCRVARIAVVARMSVAVTAGNYQPEVAIRAFPTGAGIVRDPLVANT